MILRTLPRTLPRIATLALLPALVATTAAAQDVHVPARPVAPAMPAKPRPPADLAITAPVVAPAKPLHLDDLHGVYAAAKANEMAYATRIESVHAAKADLAHAVTANAVASTYAVGAAKAGMAAGMAAQTWYQGDAADSVYRAAYGLFSRQEYRSAADRFNDVRSRYPQTRYFCDAAYYEAFARYRLGTQNDLRTASRVLDGMGSRCTGASRSADVPELTARVDAALARLGDAAASERVRRAASQGQSVCDREERNVKVQALSALAQMDPEGAKSVLNTVLATRDDCNAPVRSQALQLVARNADANAIGLLSRTARTDPSEETRLAAVEWLTRVGSDAAYNAVEELLRTSTDERVQAAAARAMARSDNPRAQATVRALAERRDVAERLRTQVIASMASHGNTPTEYWRSLYGKVESDELRRAIVGAVNRESDDGMQFLLGVARGTNEPSSVRAAAISRVRQTAPIAELYRLFETADSRGVRLSIVSGLASRKEPEATDRLIDIAKRGTDPEVRASAIRYLGQPARRDDPKVRQALADILGGQQ